MANPGEDLPKLFRSLGHDDTAFREATKALASDAEQRWPLLKAVSPRKQDETPALAAQERQRWRGTEATDGGGRKPALSLPGLGGKLALSLNKMSGRAIAAESEPAALQQATPDEVAIPTKPRARPTKKVTPTDDSKKPLSAAISPRSVTKNINSDIGLFQSQNSNAAGQNSSTSSLIDDSLKGIFERLAEPKTEKPAAKPIHKRSSFLGRLGKR